MKRFILARWQDFTRAFTGWTGVALAALLGAVLGVGVFTVFYSGSTEYLRDGPPRFAPHPRWYWYGPFGTAPL